MRAWQLATSEMAYKKSQTPNIGLALRRAAKAANVALVTAMDEHAEGVRDDFVARIEAQDFPAFQELRYPDGDPDNLNLSPLWVRRKRLKSADLRTMIATGTYVDSIKVNRRLNRGRRGGIWRVGFHPRKRARDLDGNIVDLTLDAVARIHEYGGQSHRARPHWRPYLKELRARAKADRAKVGATVVAALKASLKGKLTVKAL